MDFALAMELRVKSDQAKAALAETKAQVAALGEEAEKTSGAGADLGAELEKGVRAPLPPIQLLDAELADLGDQARKTSGDGADLGTDLAQAVRAPLPPIKVLDAELAGLGAQARKTSVDGAGMGTDLAQAARTPLPPVNALEAELAELRAQLLSVTAAEKSAADQSAAMATQFSTLEARLGRGGRGGGTGASGAVGNLVAQFNDVGMMMAAGQNPLMLAIQQGSQITQVIGPMGAGGAVKALGAAFVGMLSPINLVTYAAIAAGAAFVQWLFSTKEEARSAEDAINELSKSLDAYKGFALTAGASTDELRRKFGEYASDVKGFAEYMKGVALATSVEDLTAAIEPLKGGLVGVVEMMQRVAIAKDALARVDPTDPERVLRAQEALELYEQAAADAA